MSNAEEFDGNAVFAHAVELQERRQFLGKNMPKCVNPDCGTEQVQLVLYIDCAAQWKCRVCRTRFEYEPKP